MLLDTFFEQYGILIILLVAFAAIMLLYYFRNKKYRQAEADFQTQLKVGDKVKTYSGFYGTVEKLTNTTDGLVVTLRLGENAVVDVDVRALMGIDMKEEVVDEPATEEEKEETNEVETVETVEAEEPAEEEKGQEVVEEKPAKKGRKK